MDSKLPVIVGMSTPEKFASSLRGLAVSTSQQHELTASDRDGAEAMLQTNSITAGDELN
jgi:hypothetical protein